MGTHIEKSSVSSVSSVNEGDLLAYLDTLLERARDRPYACVQGRMCIPMVRDSAHDS